MTDRAINRGASAESAPRRARLAVLADSAVEHYRGSFHNKAMYAPLVDRRSGARRAALDGAPRPARRRAIARDAVDALAALATGLVGTGFHLYNVRKRPGAVFVAEPVLCAPIGAPAALTLAGLLGLVGGAAAAGGLSRRRCWACRRTSARGLIGDRPRRHRRPRRGCCISAAPSIIRPCCCR